jgi:hypothetical protein
MELVPLEGNGTTMVNAGNILIYTLMLCDQSNEAASLGRGCDNVLTGQSYRTDHGAVIDESEAKAEPLVVSFPPLRPEFNPRLSHVRLVVDEVALGQVS